MSTLDASHLLKPVPMSPAEIESYSLSRALRAAQTGNWSAAGFEREMSAELGRMRGSGSGSPHIFEVPAQVLAAGAQFEVSRRDLTVASASGGGFLVATEVAGVLDALRPVLLTARLGVQTLSGLRPNVTLARQGATATVGWSATEASAPTETSTLSFGQVSLSPKIQIAHVEVSHLLGRQAPELVELTLRRDLAVSAATALDTAAFSGSGASGQPLGLFNTSGVGEFTGASLDWAAAINAQADVMTANALSTGGQISYVTTPAVAEVLASRQGFNTSAPPLWNGPLQAGTVAGCPAYSSTCVPTGSLACGDWSRMLLAEWGTGLQIEADPFSGFRSGLVGYRVLLACDVAVAQAQSFSVATAVS